MNFKMVFINFFFFNLKSFNFFCQFKKYNLYMKMINSNKTQQIQYSKSSEHYRALNNLQLNIQGKKKSYCEQTIKT